MVTEGRRSGERKGEEEERRSGERKGEEGKRWRGGEEGGEVGVLAWAITPSEEP